MILALTISFAIVGLHIVIDELMQHFTGFESWTIYVETWKENGDYTWKTHLAKPLFACVTCMASIWGTFFYVLLAPMHYFGWSLVVWYLPTIFTVALFNTVIFKLYNKI